MKYPGFCSSGTYQGESPFPASDRAINFYPEKTSGAGAAENDTVLLPTAGLKLFCSIPSVNSIQAIYCEALTSRVFAIANDNLYEVFAGGSISGSYGPLANGSPYSFASNNAGQLCIAANGTGYLFNLTTNTLSPILSFGGAADFGGAVQFGFSDDYIVALTPNSRKFQISGINDATSWAALDYGVSDGAPDNLVALNVNHDEIWLFHGRTAEIFVDNGNANFPFTRLTGAFLETGCAAAGSVVRMDNTLYWLGNDERGAGVVWAANGYSPQRVSTHSVEFFFREYAKAGGISNAVAYAEQVDGHSNLVIHFPSATCWPNATGGMTQGVTNGATWVYDRAANLWHERYYWDAPKGQYWAHLARTHCYGFNRHLVGDWTSGNIYDMSDDYYDDNGAVIRRERVAPHINDELLTLFYPEFVVSVQVGAGNNADPNPSCFIQFSKDGALTWGPERTRQLGAAGKYRTRVRTLQNGSVRSGGRAAFRFVTTARVPCGLVDAFLPNLVKGTS